MEFQDVIQTTGACRAYKPDPIPDDVLRRVLDAARYAPTGGNRQGVRLIAVRDPAKRRTLRDLYLPIWKAYVGRLAPDGFAGHPREAMLRRADAFAEGLHDVPVLVVVCAVLDDLLATDAQLGRLSIVGGASVYPAVQNLMLKAREEGLGTALTTLLCMVEPDVKRLLGIPADVATAALVPLGYPARGFPKRLERRPLDGIAFLDTFGKPLSSITS